MRYADPWLYGGVPPATGGLLLAPALVLCACSDYINGTGKSRSGSGKKSTPTTCKKCKGTRLPLSTVSWSYVIISFIETYHFVFIIVVYSSLCREIRKFSERLTCLITILFLWFDSFSFMFFLCSSLLNQQYLLICFCFHII